MGEFLGLIIGFPTVLFTVPLGLSLLYWLFVIVGALDIDVFDSLSGVGEALEGADGLVDGAAEGIAEGAAEGIAEGAAEGIAEGAAEGVAEGAAEGFSEGATEGLADGAVQAAGTLVFLANVLRIGRVPITISFSLLLLFGWMFSGIGSVILQDLIPAEGALTWVLRAALGLGALVGSTALVSLILRPFDRFGMKKALGANELCGKVATLTTLTIDDEIGQANIFFDEADLNIHVRCPAPNRLKKGDKLLLISYNPKSNTYEVEPYAVLLGELEEQPTNDRATARVRAQRAQDIKD